LKVFAQGINWIQHSGIFGTLHATAEVDTSVTAVFTAGFIVE
jgi:hypothetical protein